MQLTLFIVIVTFAHLSCEVQSESTSDIFAKIDYLSPQCKAKLTEQLVNKCGESPYQTQLVEVSECTFTCEEYFNNGEIKGTFRRINDKKNGTPCGLNKVCIGGKCVERCNLDFVCTNA
uniref:Putative thrombospondin n=1 Tax=Ixodes ricinus TaxID=34613 RepID=A0A0K8RBU3_IXORI